MSRYAFCVLVLAAAHASAQTPPQQMDIAALRDALKGCRSAFTSLEADVLLSARHTADYDRVFTQVRVPPSRDRRGHFVADRLRYRLDFEPTDAASPEFRLPGESFYWDGQRRLTLARSPMTNGGSGSLAGRPASGTPLDYAYTHRGIWYADLLARPGSRFTGVASPPDGSPTICAEIPGELGKRLLVQFGPDWGYMAVKAEMKHQPPKEDTGCETWTVEEARQVNGLWLPVRASLRKSVVKQGEEILVTEIGMRMTSPKVGDDCTALLKRPEIPPGALITDEDKHVIYEAEVDGSLTVVGRTPERAKPKRNVPGPAAWLGVAAAGMATVSGVVLRRKSSR